MKTLCVALDKCDLFRSCNLLVQRGAMHLCSCMRLPDLRTTLVQSLTHWQLPLTGHGVMVGARVGPQCHASPQPQRRGRDEAEVVTRVSQVYTETSTPLYTYSVHNRTLTHAHYPSTFFLAYEQLVRRPLFGSAQLRSHVDQKYKSISAREAERRISRLILVFACSWKWSASVEKT